MSVVYSNPITSSLPPLTSENSKSIQFVAPLDIGRTDNVPQTTASQYEEDLLDGYDNMNSPSILQKEIVAIKFIPPTDIGRTDKMTNFSGTSFKRIIVGNEDDENKANSKKSDNNVEMIHLRKAIDESVDIHTVQAVNPNKTALPTPSKEFSINGLLGRNKVTAVANGENVQVDESDLNVKISSTVRIKPGNLSPHGTGESLVTTDKKIENDVHFDSKITHNELDPLSPKLGSPTTYSETPFMMPTSGGESSSTEPSADQALLTELPTFLNDSSILGLKLIATSNDGSEDEVIFTSDLSKISTDELQSLNNFTQLDVSDGAGAGAYPSLKQPEPVRSALDNTIIYPKESISSTAILFSKSLFDVKAADHLVVIEAARHKPLTTGDHFSYHQSTTAPSGTSRVNSTSYATMSTSPNGLFGDEEGIDELRYLHRSGNNDPSSSSSPPTIATNKTLFNGKYNKSTHPHNTTATTATTATTSNATTTTMIRGPSIHALTGSAKLGNGPNLHHHLSQRSRLMKKGSDSSGGGGTDSPTPPSSLHDVGKGSYFPLNSRSSDSNLILARGGGFDDQLESTKTFASLSPFASMDGIQLKTGSSGGQHVNRLDSMDNHLFNSIIDQDPPVVKVLSTHVKNNAIVFEMNAASASGGPSSDGSKEGGGQTVDRRNVNRPWSQVNRHQYVL